MRVHVSHRQNGTQEFAVGDMKGVSQPTVSRIGHQLLVPVVRAVRLDRVRCLCFGPDADPDGQRTGVPGLTLHHRVFSLGRQYERAPRAVEISRKHRRPWPRSPGRATGSSLLGGNAIVSHFVIHFTGNEPMTQPRIPSCLLRHGQSRRSSGDSPVLSGGGSLDKCGYASADLGMVTSRKKQSVDGELLPWEKQFNADVSYRSGRSYDGDFRVAHRGSDLWHGIFHIMQRTIRARVATPSRRTRMTPLAGSSAR